MTPAPAPPPPGDNPTTGAFRVVIAGGGVAALEALLALRALAGDRVAPILVAPDLVFRHRPLSVTEPFGLAAPRNLHLAEIAREHDAAFIHDGLAEVRPDDRLIETNGGRRLEYDCMLIAIGARGTDTLPGAPAFRDSVDQGFFRRLLADLSRELSTISPLRCPAVSHGRSAFTSSRS